MTFGPSFSSRGFGSGYKAQDNLAASLLTGGGRGGRMKNAMGRAAVTQLIQSGAINAGVVAAIAGTGNLPNEWNTWKGTEIDPVASQSVSNKKCLRKTARREEAVAAPLDVVERPLRLRKTGVSPPVKSAWSALRDLCTGKKVLRNSFAFKMSSRRDERGIMAIPLRHDGNFGLVDSGADLNWSVGSQSMILHPDGTGGAGDGYGEYESMMRTPKMANWNKEVPPDPSVNNVFVPRMNLPTLEQTSWDLNALKIFPQDNLATAKPVVLQDSSNAYMTSPGMLSPVMQLGGSAVPYNGNVSQATNDLPNGYPAPKNSWARRQGTDIFTGDPYKSSTDILPKFKTQLGGGTLKMRIANQGTNQVTVEFVVLKVKDTLQAKVDSSQVPSQDAGVTANMTKFWGNIHASVGDRYRRKNCENLSYKMGEEQPNHAKLQWDPIINPYKSWLPDSYFAGKYVNDKADQGDTWQMGGAQGIPSGGTQTSVKSGVAQESGGITYAAGNSHIQVEADQKTEKLVPGSYSGGMPTHYRPVSRGHCTISGAGERTVTIPIPGSCYEAQHISTGMWSDDYDAVLDQAHVLPMTDESYVVCMSVNGSLQDFIEPNQNTDDTSVRVIGKAYTGAIIDVHCEYKETVYPSYCDYSEITPVAYNLGNVRSAQVIPLTNSAGYSGKVLSMASAVPTVTSGVLRTGVKDRGGPNELDN